jgi:hypothetical protein
MENDGQRSERDNHARTLLKVLALAMPIMLASCVITDDGYSSTSFVIRYDENGLSVFIRLGQPVMLPLDEDDARYIMENSGCVCQGDLTLQGDYWQYPSEIDPHACFIRINRNTGDIDCFSG